MFSPRQRRKFQSIYRWLFPTPSNCPKTEQKFPGTVVPQHFFEEFVTEQEETKAYIFLPFGEAFLVFAIFWKGAG